MNKGPKTIKKEIKPEPRLSDLHPNYGRGLFATARAEHSVARALSAFDEHLDQPGLESARLRFATELPAVAEQYWADQAYDRRVTHAKMKADAERLVGPIKKIIQLLESMPRQSVIALNREITSPVGMAGLIAPAKVESFIVASNELLRAALALSKKRYVKAGRSKSVTNACRSILSIWQSAFGREFSAGTGIAPGKAGIQQFVSRDAQLLCGVLQGFNPDVTIAEIRTSIRIVKPELRTT